MTVNERDADDAERAEDTRAATEAHPADVAAEQDSAPEESDAIGEPDPQSDAETTAEPGADATDHRTAHSRGGSDDPSNLFPIHHNNRNSRGVSCNREKGTKDPEVQLTTSRQW